MYVSKGRSGELPDVFKASFCVNGEPKLQHHCKYLKKSSSSENVHKIRRN